MFKNEFKNIKQQANKQGLSLYDLTVIDSVIFNLGEDKVHQNIFDDIIKYTIDLISYGDLESDINYVLRMIKEDYDL